MVKKRFSHRIKFVCNFCGSEFSKASECAKHIEEKSEIGICFPTDIIVKPNYVSLSSLLSGLRSK
jgi:hypothetical protein